MAKKESGRRKVRDVGAETPDGFILSAHAARRAAERAVTLEAIDFVIGRGVSFPDRANRIVRVLPESPFAALASSPCPVAASDLAVVLSPDLREVVTLYRRDHRFRHGNGEGVE